MKKISLVIFVCTLTAAAFSFGQTAERLERISERDQITVGEAAYIAAASGGLISETDSEATAFDALFEADESPAVAADERVSLGLYAHMLMTAFERDGGLLYSLFPGPRYAFRELEFERVIQGGGDPGDSVDGRRALQMVTRMRAIAEQEQ